ncbi:Membrane protease subunit, stomatin/prohibitin family, contains C-terminal Zn-ribbon domain [Desulfatibacillum alkenivorans DSM 16219]|jgi:membrane protease subunit (stomatin/prohibitin family)|uniref:Membrane protease subunit, stomatin/prohibitin family, contains C-terminal Zn-ribbon domain n=1 Tax=Desulfatibacillum alkenivorans DSM 16219 TaxID=1121393 RepID=A0A1M6MQM7_9BACT|nr:SPFH domain-containing protein [Desulfatibacillum alkenivorans]SHJ85583.1 Membrane protease subunit, stomatin/prohibitin family, contains C-terminal Zn-ribbon domain [Desulfatibacillum alkenivorans DSM 16219]
MGENNVIFLEVIEWFDETGKQMVQRIPREGSGEIKFGAQLTVRDSQAAVFFYQGKAYDAIGPGRHTLKTHNIPVLTKVLSAPWGMQSPLRAEVYMVNMKTFTDLKWGTRDPVAFKDSQLGLVRLRAFGIFNVQVVQPVLFINRLVGTQGMYTTEEIEDYLNRVIVSRFNDHLGENLDSLFNLPGRYEELADSLQQKLVDDLSHFGLALTHLYIRAITPPPDVQQAIDDKSRLGLFDDMNKLMAMKAAMAMEKASESSGEASSGLGMGMGVMMPGMFANLLQQGAQQPQQGGPAPAAESQPCPDCGQQIPKDARFCPQCGHQQLVFTQCMKCHKNLPPTAKFCSRCGTPVNGKDQAVFCQACGAENLGNSKFCNSCGEKLGLAD